MYIYVYIHTYIYTHMCHVPHMYICKCIRIYTYTYICIYILISSELLLNDNKYIPGQEKKVISERQNIGENKSRLLAARQKLGLV